MSWYNEGEWGYVKKLLERCLGVEMEPEEVEGYWRPKEIEQHNSYEGKKTTLKAFKKLKEREQSELDDNILSGEDALRLYNDLMNPKPDPERTRFIEESERMFPNPGKPARITIELDDDEIAALETKLAELKKERE
jgi:hypothetical protein